MAIRWEKLNPSNRSKRWSRRRRGQPNWEIPKCCQCICCWQLIEDREGVIPSVLGQDCVPTERLETNCTRYEEKLPRVAGAATQPGVSQALNKVLDQAFRELRTSRTKYVSTEHLLLGVAHGKNEASREALVALARRTKRF